MTIDHAKIWRGLWRDIKIAAALMVLVWLAGFLGADPNSFSAGLIVGIVFRGVVKWN